MSTIQTIVNLQRIKLEESSERKWSDADQLIPFASQAERWWARKFSRIKKSNRFRYRETFTWTASSETFDLTTLTKSFDFMIHLSVLVGNLYIPVIAYEDDDETALSNLSLGGGPPVPRVNIADNTLWREPTYGQAQTFRIKYGYIPAIKTSGSTALETPEEYDNDIAMRAVIFALVDAKMFDVAREMDKLLESRVDEIETLERSRFGTNKAKVVQRHRAFGRVR